MKKQKISYMGIGTEYLSYLLILISLFMSFFSGYKFSWGKECIVLTVILFIINYRDRTLMEILPFVLFSGITLIMLVFSGRMGERGFNAPINHALKFVYLLFTVMLSCGIRACSDDQKSNLLKWTFASICISAVISVLAALFIDEYAIRYQAERGFNTVVDFNQFYGICFAACSLIFAIFSLYKKKSAWRFIPLAFLLLILIGVSLFVTGVLLCVMGIAIGLALYIYNRSKKVAAVFALTVIFLLLLALIFRTEFSDWIYENTESLNWIVRDRIRSVADMVFGTNHNLSYSYDRREELAGYSMMSFFKNPVLGVGYSGYEYGTIGCHQEWQDMLGVFGVLGTLCFCIMMIVYIIMIFRETKSLLDKQSFALSLMLFVIFGFLNPCLNMPILFSVFLVAPNISYLFNK